MRFRTIHLRTTVLLGLCVLGTTKAHAGPPPPCIIATLSAHGEILVINEITYDDLDESHIRQPRSSIVRVLRRYTERNDGLRLNGPDVSWADPLWSVVLTPSNLAQFKVCSYTLVTDDGEYLILVGVGTNALSIYRRRDHPGRPLGGPGPDHGVLVRQVPLSDLWPPEHMPVMITDNTPLWFAGGTFAFSPDQRTLVHKTGWGATLRISLETGQVRVH